MFLDIAISKSFLLDGETRTEREECVVVVVLRSHSADLMLSARRADLTNKKSRLVCVCVSVGKILTIETVALKLPKKQWKGPEINPDQTCFHDEYMRHLLYITRIYFHYGLPESELIGTLF